MTTNRLPAFEASQQSIQAGPRVAATRNRPAQGALNVTSNEQRSAQRYINGRAYQSRARYRRARRCGASIDLHEPCRRAPPRRFAGINRAQIRPLHGASDSLTTHSSSGSRRSAIQSRRSSQLAQPGKPGGKLTGAPPRNLRAPPGRSEGFAGIAGWIETTHSLLAGSKHVASTGDQAKSGRATCRRRPQAVPR